MKLYDEEKKQIIGYTQGSTFDREGLKTIAPNMKHYRVTWSEAEEPFRTLDYHATCIGDVKDMLNQEFLAEVSFDIYRVQVWYQTTFETF
jgi:hypothetical protein